MMTSELEQFESHAANIAQITVTYYEELIKSGVPEDLAYQLTINVHYLWWSRILAGISPLQ